MKGNYYYLHFTDEETKAQRFDVLPKISRLEREGVGIGIVRLQNCDCNHSDRCHTMYHFVAENAWCYIFLCQHIHSLKYFSHVQSYTQRFSKHP